jgi:hypothetical protein
MSSTSSYSPAAASTSKSTATTGDWVGGALISLLLPVIGLIVGIFYVTKGASKRSCGVMCVAISVGVAVAWVVVSMADR